MDQAVNGEVFLFTDTSLPSVSDLEYGHNRLSIDLKIQITAAPLLSRYLRFNRCLTTYLEKEVGLLLFSLFDLFNRAPRVDQVI